MDLKIKKEKISELEKLYPEMQAKLSDGSTYPLILVILGERPGAVIMHSNKKKKTLIKKISKKFDIQTLQKSGRESKSKAKNKYYPADKAIFVSNDKERFEILKSSSGRFYGFNDRNVGKFLGYPEEAIDYFIESESPGYETFELIEKLEKELDNTKLIGLTTYIPAPTKESIEKAIEKGKKRKELLENLDEKYGTNLGRKIVQKRLDKEYY